MKTKVKCPQCGKVEELFSVLPIIPGVPCLRCQLKNLGRENEMQEEVRGNNEMSTLQ